MHYDEWDFDLEFLLFEWVSIQRFQDVPMSQDRFGSEYISDSFAFKNKFYGCFS